MKKPFLSTVICLNLLLLGSVVYLWQRPVAARVAYVDTDRLLNAYQAMITARHQYQSEKETWQKNLATLAQEASQASSTARESETGVNKSEQTTALKIALVKQQQLLTYRQAIQQRDEQEQQRLTQPVIALSNKYISQYCKAHGYDIVFTTAGQGDVLYVTDALDITSPITAGLNQALSDSLQHKGK